MTILGKPRPHPFISAPTAWQVLAHPGGEADHVRGMAAAGGIYILSCWSSQPMEEVAAAAPDASRWFHLHLFTDRGLTRDLADRAAELGFEALVLTVDQPVAGFRYRTMRGQFERPASVIVKDRHPALDGTITWDDVAELAAVDEPAAARQGRDGRRGREARGRRGARRRRRLEPRRAPARHGLADRGRPARDRRGGRRADRRARRRRHPARHRRGEGGRARRVGRARRPADAVGARVRRRRGRAALRRDARRGVRRRLRDHGPPARRRPRPLRPAARPLAGLGRHRHRSGGTR